MYTSDASLYRPFSTPACIFFKHRGSGMTYIIVNTKKINILDTSEVELVAHRNKLAILSDQQGP